MDAGPNPSGICCCGCGQKTSLARQNDAVLGYVKNTPVRYLPGHYAKHQAKLNPPTMTRAEYVKQWAVKNQEKVRQIQRNHYLRNKEAIDQKCLEYQRAHPEKYAAWAKAWAKANPEKTAAHNHRRRAWKLEAGGRFTGADVTEKYGGQNGLCYYCHTELNGKYEVDHYIPLVLGGSNGPENIVIACPRCNRRKGAKHPDAFRVDR